MDQLFIKVTINLYPEIVYVNIYDIGIGIKILVPYIFEQRFQIRKSIGMFLGIDVSTPAENNVVTVTEKRLLNGWLLNQEQLRVFGRTVYPERKFKIRAEVYQLDLEQITVEWIKEQMEELGIKRYDIIRQLAIDKSSLSLILSGKRGLSNTMKVAFFYYFNSYLLTELHRNQVTDEKETKKYTMKKQTSLNYKIDTNRKKNVIVK